jgi:glycosyltransferase involved in cell wall biosynthesis
MIPEPAAGNQYTTLLYRTLEQAGLRYVQVPYAVGPLLRRPPAAPHHYLHFHWPEIFFSLRPRQPHRLFGLRSLLRLYAFWTLAQRRGYRLVWTVHEVDVHDLAAHGAVHARVRRDLWRRADLFFVHTGSVQREAERRWGSRRHVYRVPHGSYAGAYPDTLSRAEARRRLGVPDDAYVFAFLGSVRPYKGLDLLLDAFRDLQAQHPGAWLVAAGRPHDAAYAARIRAHAAGLERLRLDLGFVPDDEVQIYLRAADCFVAPYRHVETCGTVYLALAFDLPVVVTAQGNVAELGVQQAGILMQDPGELEAALRRMLALSPAEHERLRAGVRAAAGLHAWETLQPMYRAAFEAFEREAGPAPG